MGRTVANATIIGTKATKTYEFLVDDGATFTGLPSHGIEGLGLEPVQRGRIEVQTAEGLVERETFIGVG